MFSLSFVILPHHRLTELPLLTSASTNQKVKEPHFSGLYAHCGFALHKRIVRYLLMLVSLRYRFLDYIPTPSVPLPVSSSHSHVASVDGGRSIHFFFPCGIDCIVPLSGLCEERTCEGSDQNGLYLYFYVRIPDLRQGIFPFYPFLVTAVSQAGSSAGSTELGAVGQGLRGHPTVPYSFF